MNYSEFQHLARLFMVGALDHDELEAFTSARLRYGARAEAYLVECRNLAAMLALALVPMPPRPGAKARLMLEIQQKLPMQGERGAAEPKAQEADPFDAPLHYEPSYRN